MVPRGPALLLLLLLAAPRDGAPMPQAQANRTAAPMPPAQAKANRTACATDGCRPQHPPAHRVMMEEKRLHFAACRAESALTNGTSGCPTLRPSIHKRAPCEGGQSGEYACDNVDLLSYVGMEQLGSTETNDIWGWTDPEHGNEIAIVSLFDGTAFVDVSEPAAPTVLGKLDTHTFGSDWGDLKVYQDVAYIGSEAQDHGLQIFVRPSLLPLCIVPGLARLTVAVQDLLSLRELYGKPAPAGTVRNIPEQGHYDGFGSSHNIVLNEETGFLYAVGSLTCDGGPHILDIRERLEPRFVGCFEEDGYTHDAEVVVYRGPDEEFVGREIMFACVK